MPPQPPPKPTETLSVIEKTSDLKRDELEGLLNHIQEQAEQVRQNAEAEQNRKA